jgi:acyl-CoA dehydrogenase
VAALLLTPSHVRDLVTNGIFLPYSPDEPLGRLEDALVKVIVAEPLERRLRDALKAGRLTTGSDEQLLAEGVQKGVISSVEKELVQEAIAARNEVIRVDDFPADYWRKGQ